MPRDLLSKPLTPSRHDMQRILTTVLRRFHGSAMTFTAVMVFFAASFFPPAMANEQDGENTGRNCIALQQIKRTKVIDDNTILFYMRGDVTKKVTLAFKCPSLKFYQSFGYEVYSNRLCARVDSIITRSGSHCPISDIETLPSETPEDPPPGTAN